MKPHRDIEILCCLTSKTEVYIENKFSHIAYMALLHALGHLCQLLDDLKKDYVPIPSKPGQVVVKKNGRLK